MTRPTGGPASHDKHSAGEFGSAPCGRLLSQRREREELLGPELASEPAWTMLLALFIAHEEGKPASVAEVCSAAGTPPATALRWLATVASEGNIMWGAPTGSRDGDGIELAPDLADRLGKLFRSWIENGG